MIAIVSLPLAANALTITRAVGSSPSSCPRGNTQVPST